MQNLKVVRRGVLCFHFLTLLTLVAFLVCLSYGRVTGATIMGPISDASGAVIPSTQFRLEWLQECCVPLRRTKPDSTPLPIYCRGTMK